MDHRTVIGQDISYRRDPNERTYTYTIYAEHHHDEVLITSNDGWYGVKTVKADTPEIAANLFAQIIAAPKTMLQEIYGEPCDWFEPLPMPQRLPDAVEPVLPSDTSVDVEVLPPEPTKP
jgi:hypothetical protein